MAIRKARSILARCPLCQWSKLYWHGQWLDAKERSIRGLAMHCIKKHPAVVREINKERKLYATHD